MAHNRRIFAIIAALACLVTPMATAAAHPVVRVARTPMGRRSGVRSDTHTEDGLFVDAAIHDLMGRPSTAADQAAWTPALDGGASRSTFAQQVARTPEWARVVVTGLYEKILGRDPDPGGLTHWTAALSAGERTADLASQLYASAEFYDHAGGAVPAYVDAVYENLFNRAPDAGGRAYWIGRLDAGTPRSAISHQLFLSIESNGKRVDALYQTLLQRAPDAAGRAYWAQALVHTDDLVLAGQLVSSTEYFTKAQTRFPVTDTSTAPPGGWTGAPYTASLTASGGTPPYTWTPSNLAPGLSVDGATVNGTPTASGTGSLQLTDTLGRVAPTTLSVAITDPTPVTLGATTAPLGRVGDAYELALALSGGAPPYTWTSTALPDGLAVAGNELSGTPTASFAGSVTLTVTDAAQQTASTTFPLRIASMLTRLSDPAHGSSHPTVSDDGRFVAYVDGPARPDPTDSGSLIILDRQGGPTTVLSPTSSYPGPPAISDDGRYVAFTAPATDFQTDDPDPRDLFSWDRTTGSTIEVAQNVQPDIDMSANGNTIVYLTGAGAPYAVDAYNRATGTATQFASNPGNLDRELATVSLSADGRYAVMGQDTVNENGDLRIFDLEAGTDHEVATGLGFVRAIGLTSDGSEVTFMAGEDCATGPPEAVYRWTPATDAITQIRTVPGGSYELTTSANGRYTVAAVPPATGSCMPTGVADDLIEYDHQLGTATFLGGAEPTDQREIRVTSTGEVVFDDWYSNLVPGADADGSYNVYDYEPAPSS